MTAQTSARAAIASQVRATVSLATTLLGDAIPLTEDTALTVADAALTGLDATGHVVVDRGDLVAYLNRGTSDTRREVEALNRLLSAAGIE
ncbi:hypothetical protein ACGFNU_20900 [Spirillospora sp. NPDC048911]|uniref:hypothetical protein n=1 Tax=Spirillospora sp. NPDC048911 TaxID=3364527 RepID=UPI003722F6FB